MVKLIKLNVSGDVDEVNVSLKKKTKSLICLSLKKTELQISDKNFKLQHEWIWIIRKTPSNFLEEPKVLKQKKNFHQLPIKNEYQFGDLLPLW